MARGRNVPDEVRRLIIQVYARNRKLTAEKVRDAVEGNLRGDKAYEKFRPIPPGWPGLSTVQHVLADLREKERNDPDKEQEEPWDISALGKYPIAQEALPLVLDVSMQSQQPLTIREAQWVGRLYGLLSMIRVQQGLDSLQVSFIQHVAAAYATTERINKLMGKRIPSIFDEMLWKLLTKQETPQSLSEEYKRDFYPGMKDSRWRMDESGALTFMLTDDELRNANSALRQSGYKPFGEGMKDLGITLEVKEDNHERTSEQRAKAKGHRQHRAAGQG